MEPAGAGTLYHSAVCAGRDGRFGLCAVQTDAPYGDHRNHKRIVTILAYMEKRSGLNDFVQAAPGYISKVLKENNYARIADKNLISKRNGFYSPITGE